MLSNISGTGGGTTSVDAYTSLTGTGNAWAANATGNNAFVTMSHSGILSSLYVEINNAEATFTRTFTVFKNGSDQGVTVTLPTSSTAGNDLTNNVSYAAGDTLSIHTTATGVTTSTGFVKWALRSTNAPNQAELLATTNTAPSTTLTTYISPQGCGSDTTAAANVRSNIPTAGTLRNLYVAGNIAAGTAASGKKYDFTLVKNGSDTTLTAQMFETASTANDTTHSVGVVAADLLYTKCVPTNTPSSSNKGIGYEFNPTVDGESVLMMGTNTGISTSAARFQIPTGSPGASTATENNAAVLLQASIVQKLYAGVGTAPDNGGGTQSWTQQASIANTPTNVSAVISEANTTANDTTDLAVAIAGQRLSIKMTPSGTPITVGTYYVGMVIFIPPGPFPTPAPFNARQAVKRAAYV